MQYEGKISMKPGSSRRLDNHSYITMRPMLQDPTKPLHNGQGSAAFAAWRFTNAAILSLFGIVRVLGFVLPDDEANTTEPT